MKTAQCRSWLDVRIFFGVTGDVMTNDGRRGRYFPADAYTGLNQAASIQARPFCRMASPGSAT